MWALRELGRLLVKVAIAFAIALVLALVQAPFRGHGHFLHGLQLSCWIVGALLLLMAAVPSNSMIDRQMDYGVTQAAWGSIPGFSSLQRRPEDPTLNPSIVLGLAGIALLVFGFAV